MDIIGKECFDIIARRSFFQEFVKNDDDEILSCKMHDIVHDFAQFLSKNECFTVEIDGREEPFIDSLGQNVRHLMVKLGKGAPFPISFCSVKRLRSLLIDDNGDDEFWLTEVLPQLFDELTCLRALDFAMFQMWSWNGFIKEIPKNIEKLVHLRYLNLSRLKIEKLPETLCELYNLQLLNVESCQDLKELPQGFGKLINLMYLLNRGTESLRYLPAGIERLTSLRRVEKSSELENKKNLIDLLLYFGHGNEERKRKKDEEVLEALQPPPNLKHLGIHQYRGNNVHPHWMMSLTDLRILTLSHCINCEHLPPLGKLPSLEQLYFYSMGSVKRVGDEFLGVESDHGRASSSVVAFPKLKTIQFWDMYVLKEWDYGDTIKGEIMPRLSSLCIARCPTLRALPDHLLQTTTLQKLEIWGCPNLQKQYRR
ncbi:putative disease resistance protein At3g14460 [Citrus clementina]|uniref:putative disease resistance protein At3g14460 n=1 Tax=Citrus clementina TaxID=85681 RepID=UPI000CECEEDA|nr:putative disease resistance protein At3g14460 [Citrus x clementina]